jgi:hypothetical protein
VQDAYNGLGQLTGEYQSHSGAVNTSTTPQVQYGYSLMSGGANHSRLTSLTYPNGYPSAEPRRLWVFRRVEHRMKW